jgi:hypothetical protein
VPVGLAGNSITGNRVSAQQTAYPRLPDPNALQEKFYWCTVTPTCFRVKPFDEHIEGLSRCVDGVYVIKKQFNHSRALLCFGAFLARVLAGFELSSSDRQQSSCAFHGEIHAKSRPSIEFASQRALAV